MTKQVTEESAAAATIHTHATANKSELLNKAILALSGMSIEDLSHYYYDSIAKIGHEADGVGNVSDSNQNSLNMHPSAASSKMKESAGEDLAMIFGEGEELSEEVKANITTIFEAALESRVILEREALIEELNDHLEEAYKIMQEEITEKIDAYLSTVVETWMSENEVAIESALRNELTEDFIVGLRNLFAEHYFDMPEDKVDVVEELTAKVEDLEQRLDSTITENAGLKAQALEAQKNDIINSVCEGLALTSAEKLRSLVETVEFTGDIDAYTTKVNVIKESVVGQKASTEKSTGILTEESDPEAAAGTNVSAPVFDADVKRYVDVISRTVRGR